MDKDLKYMLKAITILDGRNWNKVEVVSQYFSEYALIKTRVFGEIRYLIFLSKNTHLVRKLSRKENDFLESIHKDFNLVEAEKIKEIEKKINHDVKAVEYYLREKLLHSTLSDIKEFIHFGLTSYDINIPSYALLLIEYRTKVLIPIIDQILTVLKKHIINTKEMSMLGRTHGQPALPTTMGKELTVFYIRIKKEIDVLRQIPIEAKLTGAIGNYNAHVFVAPEIDWLKFSFNFLRSLGLTPNCYTTQILPYESWLRVFDSVKRINNILLGFCQDIWWYISLEYFIQKINEEEVGSSTMSHKVNPITFENAEGNLGLANSMFEFFCRKLSYSRLQRDLSDSTVKRDFGMVFGFSYLAWDSILSGLAKISPNIEKMQKELEDHWEIFSEGIQTYLRLKGFDEAYELLKDKTRGKVLNKKQVYDLIDTLPIKSKDKKILKIKSLDCYSGYAVKLVDLALKEK